MRVLLVDDDEEDYLLTRDILADIEGAPYSLEWASTAAEALTALERDPPDACLLDHRLGAEDGIEQIPRLLATGFDGPIIILTGQKDRELENKALSAGAVDYLNKQLVDSHQLERALRYAFMRKRVEIVERDRIRDESLRREAEAANAAKSEFLAYISHELRTPLAALLSYADLLALDPPPSSQAEYTSAIKRNGKLLLALLDDMLDLSRIEAGKLDLEVEPVPLPPILADVVATAKVRAARKNLRFGLETPDPLPTRVVTDSKRITQMLFNLIGNAIKFTERGSVTLRVTFAEARPAVIFEIEDTGPGIPATELDTIFMPFHRLETRGSRGDGVGLGLTITYRLAQSLGIDIGVESVLDEGTVFRLTLPVDDDSERELVDTRAHGASISESALGSLSGDHLVAVVDDMADIRVGISRLLEAIGAKAVAFSSGEELIDYLEARSDRAPDLIFLDMQMPGIDGYLTARKIRGIGCSMPIVALTAAALEGAREKCLAAGCDDYLRKPVEPDRLLERLSYWLGQRTNGEGDRSAVPNGAATILVVDDDDDSRLALGELLRSAGFEVSEAATEDRAHECVAALSPRILIVDLTLGTGSGLSVAKSARAALGADIQIVGLSGRARVDLSPAEQEPFDAYFQKPVDVGTLLRELQHR